MDQLNNPNQARHPDVERLARFSRLMRVTFETARAPSTMTVGDRAAVISRFLSEKLAEIETPLDREINLEMTTAIIGTLRRSTVSE